MDAEMRRMLRIVIVVLSLLSSGSVSGQEAPEDDQLRSALLRAANVIPSKRQAAWQELEFYAFIHFGINTFTDREWGDGTESPAQFNPTEFDAQQWVSVIKDAGMNGLILTAKHHDGFCLWPSRFTEHSVKNSPWKEGRGDVVAEVAEACRAAGIKFGIYLSPWDRHEASYGDTPKYNGYFLNQLRELLTGYGEIFTVWFDGACGEGPNGKRQEYAWGDYYALIRELQPNAVISVVGPDVRWCGNEAGRTRESEWSVLPLRSRDPKAITEASQHEDDPAFARAGGSEDDLGSRAKILAAEELVWYPAETNTSIRPGWFYHTAQDNQVKSLKQLLDIYFRSVGGNSAFLLNFPPDKRGLIHENDAGRARELGTFLKRTFQVNLAAGAATHASHVRREEAHYSPEGILDDDPETYWTTDDWQSQAAVTFDLPSKQEFDVLMLQEQLTVGQRIEAFAVDAWDGREWREVARSTVVGHKRLLRVEPTRTSRVRVRILESRVAPTLSNFGLFLSPRSENQ